MKRRDFLGAGALLGAAFALDAPRPALAAAPAELLRGLCIADPHAHPEPLRGTRSFDPTTPSVGLLQAAGVALCAFAAVGDAAFFRGGSGQPFADTQRQLGRVQPLFATGALQRVLTREDVGRITAQPAIPFGLLAIEGGDALAGRLDNLETFFRDGVRMITLLHERDNEIGFSQRSAADGPLTPFGVSVVERMNALGMLVDVAHARAGTLRHVAEVAARPLIDSHTGPFLPGEEGVGPRRLRTWQEMEAVAKTGGVVCSWPLAVSGKQSERLTLLQWAEEIVRMKSRLGIEHCGLGTDGGGGLPQVGIVKGWDSIASLPALVLALGEAGLGRDEVAAFVGGNVLRVLENNLC